MLWDGTDAIFFSSMLTVVNASVLALILVNRWTKQMICSLGHVTVQQFNSVENPEDEFFFRIGVIHRCWTQA